MPKKILPVIDKQRCMGCDLCADICTSLGPDVLRIKDGKAMVAYPEKCISDGACIGVCPTKAIFWMRPQEYTPGVPLPLKDQGLFDVGWEEG
ncbi:MAG: ATP-binding protein [Nitrososphaerales archaeon]